MGTDKNAIDGAGIDPNEVAAVSAAVKRTVGGFTYMGINVGLYVTDEECQAVALAAVIAGINYRKAPSI